MKWYQVSYIRNNDLITDYVLAKSKKELLSLYKDPKPYCISKLDMRAIFLHGVVESNNKVKLYSCWLNYKERRERKL